MQLLLVNFLICGLMIDGRMMGGICFVRSESRNIATDVILLLLVMLSTVLQHIVRVKKTVESGVLMTSQLMILLLGFHLDHKISTFCIYIRWVEDTAILLETTAGLMPSTAIKGIKVVPPVELELILVLIIGEHLHIIVKYVPRHVSWVESLAPSMESWSPEVHSERLGLVKIFDGFNAISCHMTNLLSIDGKRDVFRGPLHLIGVPIVKWVELMRVILAFLLVMAITVN